MTWTGRGWCWPPTRIPRDIQDPQRVAHRGHDRLQALAQRDWIQGRKAYAEFAQRPTLTQLLKQIVGNADIAKVAAQHVDRLQAGAGREGLPDGVTGRGIDQDESDQADVTNVGCHL